MQVGNSINLNFSVSYNFNAYFRRGILADAVFFEKLLANSSNSKIIIFVEDKVAYLFPDKIHTLSAIFAKLPTIELVSLPIIMPGGEKNKNIDTTLDICKKIHKFGLCRHSYVVALGGGAFIDTICFAASIAHRGVRQIRFPTTVVSQCDSGLGVKNSVNLFGIKNYLGSFYPPFAVVNDFDFIDLLPLREKISGVAEAVKVAIIKDSDFFNYLQKNSSAISKGNSSVFEYLIIKSAQIHAEHISKGGDPFEFGNSRPLDFGHWLAHKLESLSKGKIRHGEAVSIGIASDSYTAMKLNLISEEEFSKIIQVLLSCGLPIYCELLSDDPENQNKLLSGLDEFREHLGGNLSLAMPNHIGKRTEISEINPQIILESFRVLKNLQKNAASK